MNDLVNLNRFRKKKRAIEKAAEAALNRAKYGRTKAQKARDERSRDELARHVEGHQKEKSD